jgi:hypothetical protein
MVRNNYPDIFTSRLAFIDAVYIQSRDLDEKKSAWKKLFGWKKSKRQFENVTGFTGFPTFSVVGEGEDYPLASVAQLFDKKFTHTKFGVAWQVTEEMEDDDQDELVASLAKAAAKSHRFTKEVNFSNVFNNSFGTEDAADGSDICATHTLYNGSTISNLGAADLGISAAQTVFNHFANLTDDQGIRIGAQPAYFVANPAMRWVYGEVFKSPDKPYTTDNEKNILNEENEGLTPVFWSEITDTDAYWFVAKPSDVNDMGLRAYDRLPFTSSSDFDIKNTTMLSVVRARWSRGCVDWRQVWGSPGA